MVRLTNEEAIKILKARKNCESDSCPSGVVCYKCDEAFDMAIEALELVTSYEGTINKLTEALNQQRWIPVDERLPEKEGLYLVTVKRRLNYSFATNNYEYEFVVAIRRYTKGHGYSWGMRKSQVIAWMPLPKPYKKVGE